MANLRHLFSVRSSARAARPSTKELAPPLIDYDSHPAYRERIQALSSGVRHEAEMIFNEAHQRYREEAAQRKTFAYLKHIEEVRPKTGKERELINEGCSAFRIPAPDKQRLNELANPLIQAVDVKVASKPANMRKFSDNNLTATPKEHPELTKHVSNVLQRQGVLDTIAQYVGRRVKPTLLAVQVNDAENSEFLYNRRFAATNLKPGKASYLHVDSDLGSPVKVLIYMTDVDERSGPFKYVIGSNRHADPEDLLIRKTTDMAGAKLDLDHFLALPPDHRRRTHFGFELPNEHPSTERLLSSERAFTSADGDLLCFDYNGIHRGGMVEHGRRIIMQVLLN